MQKILIDDIKTTERMRSLGNIADLIESIEMLGLMQPVVVAPDNTLISGNHRLQACKSLGYTEIDCNVLNLDETHRKIAEIDENLVRNELTELEFDKHLAERKRLYELLYPETKKGELNKHNLKQFKSDTEKVKNTLSDKKPSFIEDTANKTNMSKSAIQKATRRGEKINPKAAEKLKNTPIADKATELDKIIKQPEGMQILISEQIESGEAKTVSEAIGNIVPTEEIEKPKEVNRIYGPKKLTVKKNHITISTDILRYINASNNQKVVVTVIDSCIQIRLCDDKCYNQSNETEIKEPEIKPELIGPEIDKISDLVA